MTSSIRRHFCYFIIFAGSLAIGITLLSLLYNINLWWLKALDFPRLQILITSLLCLVIFLLLNKTWSLWPLFFVLGITAAAGIQTYYILPYTVLVSPQVATAGNSSLNDSATVSIMVANVYMKNREASAFLNIARAADPDMLLILEPDRWWANALQPLNNKYAYRIEHPLEDTYGMLLYSKYPLTDTSILFLQHNNVPSFHTKVKLPNREKFYFHGVHPVPPVKSKYPDNIGEKEEELLEVGDMILQHQMPAIVAGDFNDVAWSNTSRLFQAEGQLYDTRIGRGLYNTFDARSRLMRWPLDHVYVTEEFEVIRMERLEDFGSDHFPLFIELYLTDYSQR